MENEKQTAGKIVRVLKSGTAAGILAALAVLAVFILAATYLRSLFFGIILAIFLLPLEKFFECHVFQWRWMQTLCAVLGWPWLQVSKLIDRVAGKVPTPAEIAERRRKRLILSSSVCAFAVFLIALTAVSCLVFAGGKFAAGNMKEKMTDFGKDNLAEPLENRAGLCQIAYPGTGETDPEQRRQHPLGSCRSGCFSWFFCS